MLSTTIRRMRTEKDLNKKLQAAADLAAEAKERQQRVQRFQKIAWTLDLLLFCLAGLLFFSVVFFDWWSKASCVEDLLPSGLYRFLSLAASANGVTDESVLWLWLTLALLLLPLVFDLIFASMSRSTSARAGKAEVEMALRLDTPGKLRYIEDALIKANDDLKHIDVFRSGAGHIPCVLFALSMTYCFWESLSGKGDIIETVIYLAVCAAACLGFFELIVFLQWLPLRLSFLSGLDKKTGERLLEEFLKYAKSLYPGYQSRAEIRHQKVLEYQKQQEEDKRRRELELERYLREHPITTSWSDIQNRMERESGDSQTKRDDDDIDMFIRHMHDIYGPDWLKDM